MLKELVKIYLQLLKKKLQSKFFLLFLFLLIILISYYRVNLDVVSFYKGSELEFKLEVSDKKYENNQYTISFLGKEKMRIKLLKMQSKLHTLSPGIPSSGLHSSKTALKSSVILNGCLNSSLISKSVSIILLSLLTIN